MLQKMMESQGMSSRPVPFSVTDRVNAAIQDYTLKLEAANQAKTLLERNPDIERLLNLLQQF